MQATFWALEDGGWAVGVWGPRVLVNTIDEARRLVTLINDGVVEVYEEDRR